MLGDGGAALAFREALPEARTLLAARATGRRRSRDADLVVNATSERDEVLVELGSGQTLVDLPYPETATATAAREAGAKVIDGLEVLVAQGAAVVRALDRRPRAGRGDAPRRRLVVVTLELATAGESHGPALVGDSQRPARGARPRP